MYKIGQHYYEARGNYMLSENIGLTDTYNRFNYPHEKSPEIQKLRELHAAMDKAVLEAYGWRDLAESAHCEFLLDYEEDDEEAGKASKKKKPWRLRWPDEFRDEVLARLLELNEQRYKEELLLAKSKTKSKPEKKAAAGKSVAAKPKPKSKSAMPLIPLLEPEHRSLLMLFRALPVLGGSIFSRRLVISGMVLMLNDSIRTARLKGTMSGKGKQKDVMTVDQILNDMEIDGFVKPVPSPHQKFWRMTDTAPEITDATPDEAKKVEEVIELLRREQRAGKVTVDEEEKTVDAELDLVSA